MSPSRGITSKRQSLLFAIATVAILHLIVYRSTSSLRQLHHTTLSHSKRSLSPLVEGSHSEPTTDALIDWYSLYRDASKRHKPFVFGAMTVWLVFLFAFVGICASEFFCPNLSHIASRLGLSESVAGVTFLAFSNGSPDVFSTFSALKSNAGSLAIGELIGAASFIVSVVAGTMALITPFRVARHTFLRDVGFFTLAVLMTLAILYDSHIHLWEALTMVGLYFVYVAWVAVGGWWWSRREDKRRKVREAREEYDHTRGGANGGLEELGQEEEGGEEDQVGAFGSGAEIEWEREEEEDEGDHGVIHLPVSGSTTPRSTTGRSITSAFSSDSIIYHPTSSTSRTHSHTRGGGGGGAVTPPIPPTMNSPRLPRHHSHHHFRSRSTSLINPSTTTPTNRPPPTPLSGLGNSISSLDGVTSSSTTTSAPGTIGGVGGGGGKRLRPSLLGAIEFRDFVNSLNQDKNNATNLLSVFGGSGGTKEIGGKKKKRPGHSRTTSTFSSSSNAGGGGGNWSRGNSPRSERGGNGNGTEWNWNRGGWPNRTGEEGGEGRRRASSSPGFRPDFPAAMGKGGGRGGQLRLGGGEDTLANGVLNRRQGGGGSLSSSSEEDEGEEENPWVRAVREQDEAEERRAKIKKVPSILLTSENGSDVLIATPSPSSTTPILPSGSASSFSSTTVRPSAISTTKNDYYSLAAKDDDRRRTSQRRSILFRSILASLFPSLSQFSSKSIIGKITALLCVPALLVLNLTLPVAEEVREDEQDELNEDGTCDWGEGRREEDEVEKEENERRRRRIPKGIELPEDESDGTGLGGGLGQGDGERGEEHAGDAAERVGKRLHSPAVAHHDPHAHSHSHHLATASVEPPSPLLLDFEDDLDGPLEIDGPVTSPWLDQVSNPPPPAATTSQESNHHRFRIASESEGSTAVNRISSESSSTERPDSPTQSRELGGAGENDDEDETESLILDKMECEAARKVTRGLTAVQCTLGPVFCACALFADELEWYQPLLALCLGLFFATLSYRFFHNPRHPGRVSLCFIGFGIAMVWILMIVNEVVGVLQTLGHIFGISDAILGLTIFAMGNSLGDLVANATVARMGYPSMAIAACFGGPMLNILLGVGLSGTYLIALSPAHEPIHVEMGRTLMVSGVGLFAILLGSLIVVPMNGYRMTKRIGAILIGAYTVVLSINVAAEIWL